MSSDEEVVAAALPSLAMTPGGGLMMMGSSVYRKKGHMFRKFKALHGNDDSEDICWFAPSVVMNPRLPAAVVAKAVADDGPRARAEFENVWRDDVSDFIPIDVIEAATDFGVRERGPQTGQRYIAFTDCAGGTGQDSFTLAIAHREGDNAVLDLLRERRPRFVPAGVVAEYAQVLKLYGITEVQSDKYAGGFHSDEWRRHDIKFIACERTTSENYLACLPLLLAGRARLLDNATLRSQLVGLERQVHANARESVTHANMRAHDDLSCAAAGALVVAGGRPRYDASFAGWTDDFDVRLPEILGHPLRGMRFINYG